MRLQFWAPRSTSSSKRALAAAGSSERAHSEQLKRTSEQALHMLAQQAHANSGPAHCSYMANAVRFVQVHCTY